MSTTDTIFGFQRWSLYTGLALLHKHNALKHANVACGNLSYVIFLLKQAQIKNNIIVFKMVKHIEVICDKKIVCILTRYRFEKKTHLEKTCTCESYENTLNSILRQIKQAKEP